MVAHACNPSYSKAEAGESLGPRRQRLRLAGIAPLHSSLRNKSETRSQKKKKERYEVLWKHVSITLQLLVKE